MSYFYVTSSELRKKAGRITDLNSQFKSKASQLSQQETALCSMWEGQAKDAFHNAFNTDKEYMNQFYVLIQKYCQALEQIAQAYEDAEARNTDTATKRSY